jgi:hypothetical protein
LHFWLRLLSSGREVRTPGFRSSGVVAQAVQQLDGRWELVGVQINILPVTAADTGNMDVVTGALAETFNGYPCTMAKAEIVEALRYAADQLEKQPD